MSNVFSADGTNWGHFPDTGLFGKETSSRTHDIPITTADCLDAAHFRVAGDLWELGHLTRLWDFLFPSSR